VKDAISAVIERIANERRVKAIFAIILPIFDIHEAARVVGKPHLESNPSMMSRKLCC
jgi:hypothetical protein